MTLSKTLLPVGALLLGALISPSPAAAQAKLADCSSSQLKLTRPDWDDDGLGHHGLVFQVTNSTEQLCKLEGAPHLRLLDESGHTINITVCPNCSDYTFQVQPAEPVILRRGSSAYFLFGYTFDSPNRTCGKVARFDILFANGKPLRIEFNKDAEESALVCDIDVSAWRAGPFRAETMQ